MSYLEHPLKHCPFCGSVAKRTGGHMGGVTVKICRCSNDDCIASFKSVDFDVWNTRAQHDVADRTTTAQVDWLAYEGYEVKEK